MCLGMPMNHTFLKEGVELLAHTHTTSIEWNTALYTAGFSGMGMGPPHVLVKMVFLIHCRVTSPCCLPSGVKGVSKTKQLISSSNMVPLSLSSKIRHQVCDLDVDVIQVQGGCVWVHSMHTCANVCMSAFVCVCVSMCTYTCICDYKIHKSGELWTVQIYTHTTHSQCTHIIFIIVFVSPSVSTVHSLSRMGPWPNV